MTVGASSAGRDLIAEAACYLETKRLDRKSLPKRYAFSSIYIVTVAPSISLSHSSLVTVAAVARPLHGAQMPSRVRRVGLWCGSLVIGIRSAAKLAEFVVAVMAGGSIESRHGTVQRLLLAAVSRVHG